MTFKERLFIRLDSSAIMPTAMNMKSLNYTQRRTKADQFGTFPVQSLPEIFTKMLV